MDGMQIGIMVAVWAAIALVVVLLWKRRTSVAGQYRRVTGTLKKFASIRSYKVLQDITLDCGKETVHIDHILVGFFGLLFVNTQVENADYYGEEREEYWSVVKDDVKTRIKNPLNEGIAAMDAARKIFAKNNVYNIQMEQVVVFTSAFKKNVLYVKDTLPIVNVRKLGSLLSKTRFEKDNGVDVEQLVKLLEENKVK
ncbi:nuclease-related domain-containing protein [Hydrogenoanaerobacterium sp.]|uniref:nuclease-related domain-containing protein n=1 Tax=Hydrogenoanaerobacterium sp. TaxID=2953763 RepID=UPI00289AF2AD|nr:nuclease-related domain-containing protein [Hydrogenoanaerobacterium sp.]